MRLRLRKGLIAWRSRLQCDFALQRETLLRRGAKLVVLDMESTLVDQRPLDELARYSGKYQQVHFCHIRKVRGGATLCDAVRCYR